jgi:PST family polysaccharide transporter
MCARLLGLVGTLIVTRFVNPDDYGEVTIAAVLVMTANQLSTVGLGQYLVSRPDAGRPAAFHVTTFHVSLGVLALGILLVAGRRLGPALDVPGMSRFLPGLALSTLLDRVAFVPERILVRDLRFGVVGAGRSAGEVAFTGVCVGLAATGWGASAIVFGNVARSVLRAGIFIAAVDRRDWLEPCRLTIRKTRELLAFGLPIAFGSLCAFASRRWDNLLVSRFFGPGPAGMYNLAYNLADVPAIHVGEQIGDVLLPSFARMDAERRPAALVRSMILLALVVFPLAVGLGAVAPTVVAALFKPLWRPIGPMLVMLSALSVTRPLGWTVASYLQARQMPRVILGLEALKLVVMLLGIVTFGTRSPLWTCGAVGIAFAVHALASLWIVKRVDGVPLAPLFRGLGSALLACVPMVAAVLGTRFLLGSAGEGHPALALFLETLAGVLAYPPAALIIAPGGARDLLARVVDAVRPAR